MSTKAKLTAEEELVLKKFPKWSDQTHARKKAMWAGSSDHVSMVEYLLIDGNIVKKSIEYPPALYKIIDEAVVNALDHVVRCLKEKHKVTEIRLTFDKTTGRITIRNDGPGIEIVKHPEFNMYVPQVIFGTMKTGSNLDKNSDDIIGGTNGVGVKLTNIYSNEFIVETVYKKKKYRQRWVDGIDGVEAPVITATTDKEYTEVSFIPRYKEQFKYTCSIEEIYDQLEPLIAMRMYKAAAYAGWIGSVTCYYNDDKILINNMQDLAKMIYASDDIPILATSICPCGIHTQKHIRENACNMWEVVFVFVENNIKSMTSIDQISNVNGVAAMSGSHIRHIFEQLRTAVETRITTELKDSNIKFQPSFIYNNLSIFINAKLAGADWSSQRKDELTIDIKKLSAYQLPKDFVNESGNNLRDKILESIYVDKKKETKKKLNVDKYTPAKLAGGRYSEQCTLILPEGDSAKTMCANGITYKPKGADEPLLGFEKYGILTLGGVIMNARKESKIVMVGGKQKVLMTEKLSTNKFIKSLIEVVGLNVNYKYNPKSTTYAAEKKQLRYGRILSCVDQDHDGVGFIHSLIINLFELYWPNLLAAGFVQRFVTPVRRAVPKKKSDYICEFYSELEYRRWLESGINPDHFAVEYVKGLASNKYSDVIYMFSNFGERVFMYLPDSDTPKVYERYFGVDSEPRKQELRIPLDEPSENVILKQNETKTISCSYHALIEAKAHKLSNLKQKLYSAIDGMNESGRKIFDGSRQKFKSKLEETKVAQLAGYISEHEAYHHGEACLQQSIACKAFIMVGGVQLPQLLPRSVGLGSRNGGTSEIAQPRYTFVILNKRLTDLLYPEADMPLLKYVFDDGKVLEPEYFVPILPMAVLESVEMPADGWKIKIWARDVFDVIRNVKLLIKLGDTNTGLISMKPYNRGHTGALKSIRGEQFSFGNYYYDEEKKMIKIIELPLRIWSETYSDNIRKKPLVEDVRNYSSDEYIDIEIDLIDTNKPPPKGKTAGKKPPVIPNGKTAIDMIMEMGDYPWTDGVEEYFELRKKLKHNLNMIGKHGEVIEFPDYDDVIKYWFHERKALYATRIERQRILWELKILYYENIIKFVDEYKTLSLARLSDEEAYELLTAGGYIQFNIKLLNDPKLTPTDKLKEYILQTDISYDYIYDIREKDKMIPAIKARNEKLIKLKTKLQELNAKADLGAFPGAQIWLDELNAAEKIIREGFNTNWDFGEVRKYAPLAKPPAHRKK